LTAGGRTVTQPLVIEKDARLAQVSEADLQEQYRFAREIGDAFSRTSDMIVSIRKLKRQIASRIEGITDTVTVAHAAARLTDALTAVEGELYQYRNRATKDPLNFPPKLNNKIAVLLSAVDTGDARPTDQAYAVFKELSARLAAQRQALDAVLARDVPAFNAILARVRRPPIAP
jgi:hypothetical protein